MHPRSEIVARRIRVFNESLFDAINYQFPEILEITNQQLDLTFLSLYGLRTCAPIVEIIHQSTNESLTHEEMLQLGSLIHNMYKYKWDKLAEVLLVDYDPIHNYSDDYKEKLDEFNDGNSTLTHNTSVSDNTTVAIDKSVTDGGTQRTVESASNFVEDGGTQSTTRSGSKNVTGTTTTETESNEVVDGTDLRTDDTEQIVEGAGERSVYGFNSTIPPVKSDADESTTTTTNQGTVQTDHDVTTDTTESTTETRGNIETDSSSETIRGGLTHETTSSNETTLYGGLTHTTDEDQVTQGTKRKTGTEATENSSVRRRQREYSHLGNIGNLTTQQLLNQEIELWRWNFIEQVLSDVKDFLTLPIYE